MRIRWRGLELPTQVICDEESSTDYYGKFSIEPFERGFGTTIGNSLRRILLSSLEGAAVTRVKIERAAHEFTSLPGVLEDVTDIVLNIKGLAIRMDADEPRTIRVTRTTKGNVTAAAIETDPKIEIINHDHHLATLTDKVELSIEMVVEKGRGWRAAEDNLGTEADVNVFPIDSSFSPVTRVRYKAVDTRVGQRTNYDCLIMEIWTNGAIKPEDALVEAAKILRKHLNPFVLYHDAGTDEIIEAMPEEPFTESDVDDDLRAELNMSLADLDLSVRAGNCLESARILTVGELARCTESDLLRVRSFGKTSLREVKRKLGEIGLTLGFDVEGGSVPQPASTTPAVMTESTAPTASTILPPPPMPPSTAQHDAGQLPNPMVDTNPFRVGQQ